MITAMHSVVFSPGAGKARAVVAGVLGLPSAGARGGRLIFALPPGGLAAHPVGGASRHQLYLMGDDIQAPAPS